MVRIFSTNTVPRKSLGETSGWMYGKFVTQAHFVWITEVPGGDDIDVKGVKTFLEFEAWESRTRRNAPPVFYRQMRQAQVIDDSNKITFHPDPTITSEHERSPQKLNLLD